MIVRGEWVLVQSRTTPTRLPGLGKTEPVSRLSDCSLPWLRCCAGRGAHLCWMHAAAPALTF